MDLIYSALAVIGTLVVAFIVSLFLPGIERKFIHARIQQRVGPPITSPGIMAPLKFFFKQTINPESSMPRLYNSLPLISLIIIVILLLFLIPEMYFLGTLASVIAIVGFLKVEEIMYMFMGSLSKSVLSVRMPFPDKVKGAKHPEIPRSFFEELSSLRAFRLIAFGSFPLYIALFVAVAMTGSIYLQDIVAYQQTHGPILFSVAGVLGAIVFFMGYMILLNEYPFAILKAKPDVVEGPYLEYAAKYRAYVYITRGFLMFTLACLFSTLFLGIAPNILNINFIITLIVALLFPMIMAVMSAFSPVFTYKQFYPTVAGVSIIGVLAIVAALL
ncbi:MAG: NADH-quinone oxidoreductase subunit H [Methanobacteriaceae archaeon]|nr:NADH-quinone oxidoreductase subunit H [Methanobacteriaceae archaeon]